jgi:putative spermidine/putrescine transport system substrate-binding protein
MVERGVIPAELEAALPPADLYAQAVFPTVEQLEAARAAIAENWDTMVKADVK